MILNTSRPPNWKVRGVRAADARMECVERHVGATKKESVATVDALVTVIAANEVTG